MAASVGEGAELTSAAGVCGVPPFLAMPAPARKTKLGSARWQTFEAGPWANNGESVAVSDVSVTQ